MQNNNMKSQKKVNNHYHQGTIKHTFFDEGAREAFVGPFTEADVRIERTGRAASGRNAETREAASMLVDHWRRGGNGGRERSESQGIPPGHGGTCRGGTGEDDSTGVPIIPAARGKRACFPINQLTRCSVSKDEREYERKSVRSSFLDIFLGPEARPRGKSEVTLGIGWMRE